MFIRKKLPSLVAILFVSLFIVLSSSTMFSGCGETDACQSVRNDCLDSGGIPSGCSESSSGCFEKKCTCTCKRTLSKPLGTTSSNLEKDSTYLFGSWNAEGEWVVTGESGKGNVYHEKLSGSCYSWLEDGIAVFDCSDSFQDDETRDTGSILNKFEFAIKGNSLILSEYEHDCISEEDGCLCASRGTGDASQTDIGITIFTESLTCSQPFKESRTLKLSR
ncbi:MAG: hypothetical protein ACE5EN_01365 [Nitrospinota bacterium]